MSAVIVIVVAGMATLGPAYGGTPAPIPLAVSGVNASRFPRVDLTVTPPPQLLGVPLPPSAFSLTEEGQARPVDVAPLPADQRQIVVVIDTSDAMANAPLPAVKAAAEDFVARMPAGTPIGVVGVGAVPVVASPVSLDRNAATGAIDRLQTAGPLALYDGLRLAAGQFLPNSFEHDIVVVAHGDDQASATTLKAATQVLASGEIHIQVVTLSAPTADLAGLDALVAAGGGYVTHPARETGELKGIFASLADELATQYRVSFMSASQGVATLEVAVSAGGLVARSPARVVVPTAAVARPPAGRQGARPQGFIASWRGLVVGGIAVFAGLALMLLALLHPYDRRARRQRLDLLGRGSRTRQAGAMADLTERAVNAADAALERRGRRGSLNALLEQAGVALRPGEFAVLALSATSVMAVVGLMVGGLLWALLLGGATAGAARLVLSVLGNRRRGQFGDQLGDTLQLMSGSLRAGYGLLQAVDSVAREAERPTSDEFRRLVVETRLGRDLSESLAAAKQRVGTEDFDWVIQAIEINREVGGDLAEVLDNVAGTIRERNQLRRQVKSLSAEGRLSAYVLLALPPLMALFMRARNPSYFAELTHGAGLVLSCIGMVAMVVGAAWLRKLCRLVY